MQRILQNQSMHPGDLMKSDLLSEILLVGGGVAVAVSFLMVMVATVASWWFPA
jgi:hypothetical protein